MKKIYRNYIIQKKKNSKCLILGTDQNYKATKVEECLSEEEANNKRILYQKKSNIYYDLYNKISNTILNHKASLNQGDAIQFDFNDIVDLVLKEYKANLIRKEVLVSNIINTSIKSSREGFVPKI